jgi:hypothetical protein
MDSTPQLLESDEREKELPAIFDGFTGRLERERDRKMECDEGSSWCVVLS